MPVTFDEAVIAAKNGDLATIKQYVATGGSLDLQDHLGRNLLLIAVAQEYLDHELAMYLINQGLSIDGTTDTEPEDHYLGASLIHCAYLHGTNDKLLFKYLVERNDVDLNATCDEGYTGDIIHFPVTMYPLGNRRSYTDGYNIEKGTLLHFAVLNNDLETVKQLYQTGRVNLEAMCNLVHNKHLFDPRGGDAPLYTIDDDNFEVFVSRTNVQVSRIRNCTALHLAARANKADMIAYLISVHANANAKDSLGHSPNDYLKYTRGEKRSKIELKDTDNSLENTTISQTTPRPKKRLYVGEANFCYTQAVINKHKNDVPTLAASMIATEYADQNSLLNTYGQAFETTLAALRTYGVEVQFGVDARKLHHAYTFSHARFERIHFNFPHDRSNFQDRTLPKLISDFFTSASKLQLPGDEIHIALPHPADADKRRFYHGYVYGIFAASARESYVLDKKRKFGSDRYPGYQHAITGSRSSATVAEEAREFIFKKTTMKPSEIEVHTKYGPGGNKYAYGQSVPYLKEIVTDDESSDYSDIEETKPNLTA